MAKCEKDALSWGLFKSLPSWLLVLTFISAFAAHDASFSSKTKYLLKTWRRFPEGFVRPTNADGVLLLQKPQKPKEPIRVTSVKQLKDVFHQGYRVQDIDVRGDIASLLKEPTVHPVVKALHERKAKGTKPGERDEGDKAKIAVAIEGGGMRGCVSAGMISVSAQHRFITYFLASFGWYCVCTTRATVLSTFCIRFTHLHPDDSCSFYPHCVTLFRRSTTSAWRTVST